MYSLLKKVIFFAFLVGIWELLFRQGVWPEYVLPSPLSVGKTLINGFHDKTLLIGIAISMKRIAIGYGISVVIGVSLGLLTGRVKLFDDTVGSLISGLQTLPTICWLPLSMLWFGLNDRAIIFLVAMGAVLSITLGTDAGAKSVPPLYIRAARTMGAKGWKLYVDVIIPAILPHIITGMKQGWAYAWRSLMAAELLMVCLGLGHLLTVGRELNDMSRVIAVMVVLATIGILVDRVFFAKVERRIRERWGLTKV